MDSQQEASMRYPSAKSGGFAALIWGLAALLAACIFIVPDDLRLYVIAGTAITYTLLFWIWFGTWYEFRESILMIRFGPFSERIPYIKIFEANAFHGMVSSMALSSTMIELRHGKNYISGTTYISPRNREEFLAELHARCADLKT
jgi:hypothetical protein